MTGTLWQALAAVAERQPDATAIWYGEERISYAELQRRVRRCAAGLRRLGISRGDRVALWLPNVPAWIVGFFALALLGAMALATNTRFRGSELRSIFSRSGVRAVLYWPGYRGVDFETLLREVAQHLPDLSQVIEYGEGEGEVRVPQPLRTQPPLQITRYADLEQSCSDSHDDAGPELPCLLYTTSGTTSEPKLVMHSQGRIAAFAREVAAALGYDQHGACSLQAVPLCGTFGLVQAMAALLGGAPMALMHTFSPEGAADLIRRRHVTLSGMTDEMVRALYAVEAQTQPFPGLRLFVGTRAQELLALSEQRGFRLMSGYGSSEVQALFSRRLDSEELTLRATGGGAPVSPQAKIRARSIFTGEILPPGVVGEIEILAPSVMLGYLNDAEATARAFTDDGYYRSGDLGIIGSDGSWTFISRMGDSLRLRGFLVNPMEIESHVRKCPGVDLCCVVGVELGGRTEVVAFYTAKQQEDPGEEALLRHCMEGIARYKVPARFVRVAEFPMIDSMNTRKLNRSELRAQALALLQGSVLPDQKAAKRRS